MRISFDLADAGDDAPIRALLRDNPMPGDVTVAFEREPDYFFGHGVLGDRCVTVKAVDEGSGKLAGIVCIASSQRFVGSKAAQVGYIGGLRIDREYRGSMIPLRAMHYVRRLVSRGRDHADPPLLPAGGEQAGVFPGLSRGALCRRPDAGIRCRGFPGRSAKR